MIHVNHRRDNPTTHSLHTMKETNETHDALDVITRLDERINLEHADINGRRTTTIHAAYSSGHLFAIEQFVRAIETDSRDGPVPSDGHHAFVVTIDGLSIVDRYYGLANDWLQRYSEIHRYSTRVDVFYDVCKEFGLLGTPRFWFGKPDEIARPDGARYADLFAAFVDAIRERVQTREFKERERLRLMNSRRNRGAVLELEEAMFSEETGRPCWLVMALTLAYRPEFREKITLEQVQRHRDRFFAARRFNTLIAGISNYVWVIEQGEDTGLHLHVILFYRLAKEDSGEFIAHQICQYWNKSVTGGRGQSWTNPGISEIGRSGCDGHQQDRSIGLINRHDAVKRDALRAALMSLAKATQYLLIKDTENAHTFGMGQVPKQTETFCAQVDAGLHDESDDQAIV